MGRTARSSRTLIRDVDLLTLDPGGAIHRGSSLAIEGRTIVAVGKIPEDFSPDEIVDGYNHAVLPAFFNAHCHAAMTYERGWAEDLPFDRWLNEKIWVAEAALQPDDVYWGAALAACEMMRGGVAGFNDHYFYMDRVAEVVEASGMKAGLTWCVFGIGDEHEVGANLDGTLAFIDRWQGRAEGRLQLLLGPHSPYLCPPNFLRRVAEAAAAQGLAVHLHVSESQEQVDNSIRAHGLTPVAHLESLGIFDGRCIAAHCLSVSDEDLDILARRDVTVAHTPTTYMKLAMGVNDLSRFTARGINVAIGTDGPGSNADMDMPAALRQTAILQKHEQRNPEALPGDLALRMATQNGARAIGFERSGVLAPGMSADLVLVDLDKPHLLPRHDLVANLVHAMKASDVTGLMVDGEWLFRNGEILTLDEEKIKAEAEQGAFRLVGREMWSMRRYKA
ncbi:MAG TPA: amidohydrolase [Anaerolineales bacterium]|nr:amidohydrolase [Anaerolineales bacterium]